MSIHSLTRPLGFADLVASCVWQHMLDCFPINEALLLDSSYGHPQKEWLIKCRLPTTAFSPDAWNECMRFRQLGTAIYLKEHRVACLNLDAMIQWACDHKAKEFLLIWTTPEFQFYDVNGELIETSFVPSLDTAVENDDVFTVAYALWRYPTQHKKLLRHAATALQRILGNNRQTMYRLVVPKIARITSMSPIITALEKKHFQMAQMALRALDRACVPAITEKFQIVVAKSGNVDVFLQCTEMRDHQVAMEAFQTAFSYGRAELVQHIWSTNPTWMPSDASLHSACEHGHFNVLQLLPASVRLPHSCMDSAVKCADARILHFVHQRVDQYKFTPKLLTLAIRHAHAATIMMLYIIGKYKEIPKLDRAELVQKNRSVCLQLLHDTNAVVYTEEVFLEAAKAGDLSLLQSMMQNPDCIVTKELIDKSFNFAFVSPSNQRTAVCSYLNSQRSQVS